MQWLESYFAPTDDIWSQVVFRLNVMFDVIAVPHWSLEYSTQPQDEIWLIKSGRCIIQQGDCKATARAGDIVALRPGRSRLTFNPDAEPVHIIGFGFSAMLLGVLDVMELWQPPLCFSTKNTQFLNLFDSFSYELRNRGPAYGLSTIGLTQCILAQALRSTENGNPESLNLALERLRAAQGGPVADALRYIESHYHQPLNLEQLARAVHLSPKHLSRRFKSALGLAPSDYWRHYRLQQARALLTQGEENIARVALRCGFEDAAYFSRAFKRQFGATPQEFRSAVGRMFNH